MSNELRAVVVIPAYGEEVHVAEVVRGARQFLTDVWVIDDGSPDATAARARDAGAYVIQLKPNRGKGAALRVGLFIARRRGFEAAVTLDADGQHDPARIPTLLAPLNRGVDVVIGARAKDPKLMPVHRLFANAFSSVLISFVAGRLIRDSQTGYRALRLAVVGRLPLRCRGFDYESEMLLKAARAGAKFAHVDVPTIYGAEKSKIKPLKDTWKFFRVILKELISRCES